MSKDLYRTVCNQQNDIPIFFQDWWLDIVCGDDWDALLFERKEKILAVLPLYKPCRHVVSMPHYTQMMGIWFADESDDTKYTSRIEHQHAICRYFISELLPYRSFLQSFHYDFTDWLPFYWKGYSQTTRYTYILHNIKDSKSIESGMNQQTRRNIKSAKNAPIQIRHGIMIDQFLEIQEKSFRRQQKKNKQSNAILRKLIKKTRERGQGEIFGGFDKDNKLHAAAFIVWQDCSAHYIAGGGDPDFRKSGAHSLVMWEAIRYVSKFTDKFDFDGSMLPGVELFFRGFGAEQTPYFTISRNKQRLIDRIRIKLKTALYK